MAKLQKKDTGYREKVWIEGRKEIRHSLLLIKINVYTKNTYKKYKIMVKKA